MNGLNSQSISDVKNMSEDVIWRVKFKIKNNFSVQALFYSVVGHQKKKNVAVTFNHMWFTLQAKLLYRYKHL